MRGATKGATKGAALGWRRLLKKAGENFHSFGLCEPFDISKFEVFKKVLHNVGSYCIIKTEQQCISIFRKGWRVVIFSLTVISFAAQAYKSLPTRVLRKLLLNGLFRSVEMLAVAEARFRKLHLAAPRLRVSPCKLVLFCLG